MLSEKMREIVFKAIKQNPSLVDYIQCNRDPVYINYLNRFFPELEVLQVGCDCYNSIMLKQKILEAIEEKYLWIYNEYFDLKANGDVNESTARINDLFKNIMEMLSSNNPDQVEKAKLAIRRLNELVEGEYRIIEEQLEEEHRNKLRKIINKKVSFLSDLQAIKDQINRPSLFRTVFGVGFKEKRLRREFYEKRTEYEEYDYLRDYSLSSNEWNECVNELERSRNYRSGIPGIIQELQEVVNENNLQVYSEPSRKSEFGKIKAIQKLIGILDMIRSDLNEREENQNDKKRENSSLEIQEQ